MMLHGIESPDVRYKDTLEEAHADDSGAYSLILANPPLRGQPRLRGHRQGPSPPHGQDQED